MQQARRPSVVFFNRVYPPVRGATGRVLRDLAQSFAAEGWDVRVVTTDSKGRQEKDGLVSVTRLKTFGSGRGLFSWSYMVVRMLVAGLTMKRADLVVTMTDPPLFVVAGRLIAHVKKTRHMHWCQDLYPDLLPALGIKLPTFAVRHLRTLSRRSMKKCEKVVVIGRCMARHLTHGGLDPRRIAVIPNWPDRELSAKEAGAADAAKPVLQANGAKSYEEIVKDTEPKFRILYAGSLGRAHPVKTILDAAALLEKGHPEIEFVFVGDGAQFERLAQERTRRGLENIRFLPWQPENRLKTMMESGDLHLISMRDDVAGLLVPSKLYAALAVGRPCILIGPQQTETARVIEDFRAGSIVPQEQPETLAETILSYRMNGATWYSAHQGAAKAGRVFLPEESMRAWVERAVDAAGLPHKIRRRAS